jgi:hypothetical protein
MVPLRRSCPSDDLLALDEALTRLAAHDPVRADLVKRRFFAGLTMPESAQALGLSPDALPSRFAPDSPTDLWQVHQLSPLLLTFTRQALHVTESK